MGQNSKTRYNQMLSSDPTEKEPDSEERAVTESYPEQSNARNITFKRADGRTFFLSYSYLVYCDETEEDTCITLLFTTHTVTLKGVGLKALIPELAKHTPKNITCTEIRYNPTMPDNAPIVNEIILTPNG